MRPIPYNKDFATTYRFNIVSREDFVTYDTLVDSNIKQEQYAIQVNESDDPIRLDLAPTEPVFTDINDHASSNAPVIDNQGVTQYIAGGSHGSLTDSQFYYIPGVETDNFRQQHYIQKPTKRQIRREFVGRMNSDIKQVVCNESL